MTKNSQIIQTCILVIPISSLLSHLSLAESFRASCSILIPPKTVGLGVSCRVSGLYPSSLALVCTWSWWASFSPKFRKCNLPELKFFNHFTFSDTVRTSKVNINKKINTHNRLRLHLGLQVAMLKNALTSPHAKHCQNCTQMSWFILANLTTIEYFHKYQSYPSNFCMFILQHRIVFWSDGFDCSLSLNCHKRTELELCLAFSFTFGDLDFLDSKPRSQLYKYVCALTEIVL